MRVTYFVLLIPLLLLVACVPVQPQSAASASSATPENSATREGANDQAPDQTLTEQTTPSQTASSASASEANAEITPQTMLEWLFTEPLQAEAWFDEAFLTAVPEEQIAELITQLTTQLGALQAVEGEGNPYTLVFDLGTIPATIQLDAEGRIETLFFESPTYAVTDIDEAVAMIGELPGEVSVLATKNGEEIAALNAETPLGVGSAYKLAVLKILRQQIEEGIHQWDEVVTLAPEWKAPPASLLRDWPDDSPITLHTLATLMISISDNTAADALLQIVGREEVETLTPNSRPLLTTQELFKLKSPENADLLEEYRASDEAGKRAILDTLATLPPPQAPSTTPILDVEWFFTAYELCDLIAQVEDLPLMSVTPGPASSQPDRWSHIAFKGGSELGVLNLTTWLETEAGDTYCVTMTQNNPEAAIDENEFISRYRTLVAILE
jgi:beta-lactamase class A